MYKIIFFSIALCLALVGCKQNHMMTVPSNSSSNENKILDGCEAGDRTDKQMQAIVESVEKIDFSVREYSVDNEIYNGELDTLYKDAFFDAITNQTPIYIAYDSGYPRCYKNLLRGVADLDNKEFFDGVIKRAARYYYFDYDGDGLPELTIDYDGPCVLKFIPDKKQVWLIERIGSKAEVIGSGQMYIYDSEAANRVTYTYYSTDKYGIKDYIYFEKYFMDGVNHYFVSTDERYDDEATEVDKSLWEEMRQPLMEAKGNALEPVLFQDIFNESYEQSDISKKKPACEYSNLISKIRYTDFTIREYPINRERYTQKVDSIYKKVYLKAITNQIPIYDEAGKQELYKELLQGVDSLDSSKFLENVLKHAASYYYFDYDGDGFPELIIDVDGPVVLKYIPEMDQVHIIVSRYNTSQVIGSGQIYIYDSQTANRIVYGYLSLNNDESTDYVGFEKNVEDGIDHYFVCTELSENIEVEKKLWLDMREPLMQAKESAIKPVSFQELFGDGIIE